MACAGCTAIRSAIKALVAKAKPSKAPQPAIKPPPVTRNMGR